MPASGYKVFSKSALSQMSLDFPICFWRLRTGKVGNVANVVQSKLEDVAISIAIKWKL